VDDLAVAYSSDADGSLYKGFITAITSRFELEDEGPISDLLAIEFDYSTEGSIKMHQCAYIEKMVAEFGSVGKCSSSMYRTPYATQDGLLVLERHVAESLLDESPRSPEDVRAFQKIVGSLLYCATNTRCDIAYAVAMLCRCMSRPTPDLFKDARHVLGYLEKTKSLGLTYARNDKELYGFSDSDWATKHSTSGYVFMFNSAAISYGSLKQTSVALSSCEAEIMAASEAAKEGKFLSGFLAELDEQLSSPLEIGVDNQAARDLAYNPEHHKRTKHIDRRHFYVRELVENHTIRVPFVRTADNLADLFTKSLNPRTFLALRNIIMNVPLHTGGAPSAE
jgi:hypothetical protein